MGKVNSYFHLPFYLPEVTASNIQALLRDQGSPPTSEALRRYQNSLLAPDANNRLLQTVPQEFR